MNSIINKVNYPNCCAYIEDEIFFIKDEPNGESAISNKDDYHLKVLNRKKQKISFFKIDKCVFNDGDDNKCDCSLANEELIYFVEIKELEFFDDSQKSHNKKSKKRIEAREQLSDTINNLKLVHTELDLKKVYAIIALQPKLEDNYIKIITSKVQNVIDSFIESCGCPNIYEGNVIEFN
jgi:hypothetical protein